MKMKYMLAGALLTTGCAMADVIEWPTLSEYNPLYSEGVVFSDIHGDSGDNGHRYLDYVGGDDGSGTFYAAAYMLYRKADPKLNNETEDQLLFRFRVNDDKRNDTGAYQVFFETDGDTSVEYVLQMDVPRKGIAELTFGAASGTNRNGVTFESEVWKAPSTAYASFTGDAVSDGSLFHNDNDFFLDIAMPWTVFTNSTGITSTNDAFRVLLSSSKTGGQINDGDIGNSPAAPGVDISFEEVYTDPIPEPAVITLIAGMGIALLAGKRIFTE